MNHQDPKGQFLLLAPQDAQDRTGKPFAKLLARFKRRQDALAALKNRHRPGEQVLGHGAALRQFALIA